MNGVAFHFPHFSRGMFEKRPGKRNTMRDYISNEQLKELLRRTIEKLTGQRAADQRRAQRELPINQIGIKKAALQARFSTIFADYI